VTRGRMFPLGVEGAQVPGRRGYGTKGRSIILRTNYLRINTAYESNKPDLEKTWYRYEVKIAPEQSKSKRRRFFDKLLKDPKFEDVLWASDYAQVIVTAKQLDLQKGLWLGELEIPSDPGTSITRSKEDVQTPVFVVAARRRNTVKFEIKLDNSFTHRPLIDYLRSSRPGAEYGGAASLIQLFNIILCKAPNEHNSIVSVGQNKFYPFGSHPARQNYELGGGLEALRGYYSSVRPAVGRLILNVNVTSGAFYKPLRLVDLLQQFGGGLDQQSAFIRLLKVTVEYKKDGQQSPFMTKTKTLLGFAKPVKRCNARDVRFRYRDMNLPNAPEREVSVFEYFRKQHGITLQRPDLPVLNCGTHKDPQYLPQELCLVLPGQAYRALLSGDQTSEMLRFAARSPNLNAMSIAGTPLAPGNGLRLLRLKDPTVDPQIETVQPWGFRINANELLTVPGRILSTPQINYSSKKENPRNGSWNCINQKFVKPGNIGIWQVLVINRHGNRGNALNSNPQGEMHPPEALFNELGRFLGAYGLNIDSRSATQNITLDGLARDNRTSNNRKIEQAFRTADLQRVRFLFVVLCEADKWLYARIKYYGDIKFGIHTINAVGSKLQNPRGQGMCVPGW